MKKISNPINKFIELDRPKLKVLIVFAAFTLMIVSSCLIMNNTLSHKLTVHAESSIADVQSLIEIVLTEPKITLNFIADKIEDAINRGEGFEAVQELLRRYSSDEFKGQLKNYSFYSIYGFFDVFDEFYSGVPWTQPESYIPRERPWYIAALESDNSIVITHVYLDLYSNTPVIGYSRSLHDDSGKLLGVVSMDVPVSFINEIMRSTITESSYGFIVDEQLQIIVHPSQEWIGVGIDESSPEIGHIIGGIRGEHGISRTNYISYTGARSILFSSETFNGWYVNFMVPAVEYYEDLYVMLSVISLLGLVMAVLLSYILIRIDAARKMSELKSHQKSNFLANMSHEIRTPMNSIIGFSELALDDDVSPKTKHYLRSIADNAKWLLNIINDILDSSKIESGTIVLEHIHFDLHDVISQCQSAILPKAVEKGIILYCYAEPLNNKTLIGDPVRLRQVFMNLLSNAIKFTTNGSVKFLSSVRSIDEKHARISFEIKDSGIGMTPEQIKHIFKPFMQADDTVTRNYGGTGLGLSITKSILDLMNGSLAVESEPGAGSIFSFELTFDVADSEDVEQQKLSSSGNLDRPNFNGKVLVCEDNGLNQQVICEHLARVGLSTVVANNGQEAIDAVMEHIERGSDKPFDLIFMDIHMPVMDGLEASSRIVNMGIKTPIIALTANIMSNDLEIYKSHGMHDYLGKPFTSQDLWKCLLKYFSAISFTSVSELSQNSEESESLIQLRIYFARSNKDIISKINQAINDVDFKLSHRLLHTLKGNAGQIGEVMLQETAARIEALVSSERLADASRAMSDLDTELRMVLTRLAPLINEADKKSQNKITDTQRVRQIMDELEPMLEKSNPGCMKYIDEIRAIPEAEKLALYVQDFEFKKALEELKKLKEGITENE
ncbi:MAG: ATP-binding protein [Oscillospiraceae bacterium]|nr:ATP-binding protein [Oscillospiraceae bacterium]